MHMHYIKDNTTEGLASYLQKTVNQNHAEKEPRT